MHLLKAVYSPDDVAVAKLMVNMDRLGFGPKDGHDPEDLRYIYDFVQKYVVDIFKKYYQDNLDNSCFRDLSFLHRSNET